MFFEGGVGSVVNVVTGVGTPMGGFGGTVFLAVVSVLLWRLPQGLEHQREDSEAICESVVVSTLLWRSSQGLEHLQDDSEVLCAECLK